MALAKSARARPTLRYHEGGLLSNVQCSLFPPSPLASIAMTMCGLIQSIFERVPVTEMCFPISKIADVAWCADTAVAKSNKTVHIATGILCLKDGSPCSKWFGMAAV